MDPPEENGISVNFGTTEFGSGQVQPKEKIRSEPLDTPPVEPVEQEEAEEEVVEEPITNSEYGFDYKVRKVILRKEKENFQAQGPFSNLDYETELDLEEEKEEIDTGPIMPSEEDFNGVPDSEFFEQDNKHN